MTRVKQKLKSQDGASIILAMLLLLFCIMVGSSIMAAGMSNAAKNKGRREAQQEYFMVKSALELVLGELEKMKYEGAYYYSGHEVSEHYVLEYWVKQGAIGITPEAMGASINLPTSFKTALRDDFDRLYALPFYYAKDIVPTSEEVYQRTYGFYPPPSPPPALPPSPDVVLKFDGITVAEKQTSVHKFNVKVVETSTGSFPGFDSNKPLKGKTVDITVEIVESDLSLKITAGINGTDSNKMEALMKLKTGSVFALPTDADVPADIDPTNPDNPRHPPEPLTWKTTYIRKAVDR